MKSPTLLERQLAASVAEVQQRKRDDLDDWLDAAPVPPKRLKRTRTMTAALAKIDPGTMLERVVVHGDLSKLAPGDRAVYYGQVCESLGLNPLTRPFEYLTLNGKQILYARRDCTDQLRKIHNVSVTIKARESIGDLMVVTATAQLPSGRQDESTGAVSVANLKGEALANAMMKAETKAKRRVTLSICGLAVLDESELDGVHSPVANISPHSNDSGLADEMDSAEFEQIMAELEKCKREVFDPGCSWTTMNYWRGMLGTKANPAEFSKNMSALYKADKTSEQQRKALGSLWNSCDRKLTALEGKLKPPPVEASFTDEPDGTEAFEPTREPGEDDD